jgi:hypothetical protein
MMRISREMDMRLIAALVMLCLVPVCGFAAAPPLAQQFGQLPVTGSVLPGRRSFSPPVATPCFSPIFAAPAATAHSSRMPGWESGAAGCNREVRYQRFKDEDHWFTQADSRRQFLAQAAGFIAAALAD